MDENGSTFCADLDYPSHIKEIADGCGIKDPVDYITAFDDRPALLPRGEAFRLYTLQKRAESFERERLDAEADRDAPPMVGQVYFVLMKTPAGDYIKIGTAMSAVQRFNSLTTGSPFPMQLIGIIPVGGQRLERQWHCKFDHIRVRGEWFQCTVELMDAAIAAIRETTEIVASQHIAKKPRKWKPIAAARAALTPEDR